MIKHLAIGEGSDAYKLIGVALLAAVVASPGFAGPAEKLGRLDQGPQDRLEDRWDSAENRRNRAGNGLDRRANTEIVNE
ncbi:MAG: hypothetical protein AB8B57_14715 [Congregibacter sp.]